MTCYQSTSATIESGITGFVLVIKAKVHDGIVPTSIENGNRTFQPKIFFQWQFTERFL